MITKLDKARIDRLTANALEAFNRLEVIRIEMNRAGGQTTAERDFEMWEALFSYNQSLRWLGQALNAVVGRPVALVVSEESEKRRAG